MALLESFPLLHTPAAAISFSMPHPSNKTDDPCEECRNRHLKCDTNRPRCENCIRTGQKCCRTKGLRKFRDGSSAQYEKQFAKDQVWLAFSKNAKIQIVDQTPELENFYSIDEPEPEAPTSASRPQSSIDSSLNNLPSATSNPRSRSPSRQSTANSDVTIRSPVEAKSIVLEPSFAYSPNKRRKTDHHSPHLGEVNGSGHLPPITEEVQRSYVLKDTSLNHVNQPSIFEFGSPTEAANVTRKIEAEFRRLADTEAARIPDEPFLSPVVWKQQFFWPNQYTTAQCECLYSYYIERLGPWFDVGDPSRHFTTVVPARARRCPPLLNALFAAAALHLRFQHKKKYGEREVVYRGVAMPDLKNIATLKYYHAAISYLRVLSANETHVRDEDLLAATVILRYYEELEAAISVVPPNSSSRLFQLMVAGQARPAFAAQIPYESYTFSKPGAFDSVRFQVETYLKSYRHASFRTALRQECARALIAREPVALPLEAWSVLESFDEVEDSIWTDRHLYHYAQVLQFCFSQKDVTNTQIHDWQELKEWENRWEYTKPLTFAAYRKVDPVRGNGEVFPKLWYASEVHSAAQQYYLLSRILLTVYDPNLPRIGPGSRSATRKVSEEVRKNVILLCGIAMSTLSSQPALMQAYNAIAMFGEHFLDRMDQEALMDVLDDLESNHGWPTRKTMDDLKEEWGW